MKHVVLVAVATLCVAVPVLAAPPADANLHQMLGTMTGCGCDCYAITPTPTHPPTCDWICFGSFTLTSPSQHFDAENPAIVSLELEGQAIAQCGALQPSLPRKVQALFWMQGAGIDYTHNLVRSPGRAYYLIDNGTP